MKKNIYAYTVAGFNPAYISINIEDDGQKSITVRTQGDDDICGPTAIINLPEEELLKLAEDIKNSVKEKN